MNNYEHHSHTHCWDQEQPPACGISLEKHTQCCLCDLSYEPFKKCTCTTKYCKHYEGDFDRYVKENTPKQQWEIIFDSTWKNTQGITVMDKPLREFIRSLLHSTREETIREVWEIAQNQQEEFAFEGIPLEVSQISAIQIYAQSHGITLSTPPKE